MVSEQGLHFQQYLFRLAIGLGGALLLGGCWGKKSVFSEPSRLNIEGDLSSLQDTRIRSTVVVRVEYVQNQRTMSKSCSGVVISDHVVLTAAHCLTFGHKVTVYAHEEANGDLKQSYPVRFVKFPNQRNFFQTYPSKKKEDLAALVLSQSLDSRFVKSAILPDLTDKTIQTLMNQPSAPQCGFLFAQTGAGRHGGLDNRHFKVVLGTSMLLDAEYYTESDGPLIAMLARTDSGDSVGPLFVRNSQGQWTVVGTLVGLHTDKKTKIVSSLYVPLFDHMEFIAEMLRLSTNVR